MLRQPLGQFLSDVEVVVRLPSEPRKDNIVGFAELLLYSEEGVMFKVRGFTIKVKRFGDNPPVLSVDFPAYPSAKRKFNTSFLIEGKNIYEFIIELILEEFGKCSGGRKPDEMVTI